MVGVIVCAASNSRSAAEKISLFLVAQQLSLGGHTYAESQWVEWAIEALEPTKSLYSSVVLETLAKFDANTLWRILCFHLDLPTDRKASLIRNFQLAWDAGVFQDVLSSEPLNGDPGGGKRTWCIEAYVDAFRTAINRSLTRDFPDDDKSQPQPEQPGTAAAGEQTASAAVTGAMCSMEEFFDAQSTELVGDPSLMAAKVTEGKGWKMGTLRRCWTGCISTDDSDSATTEEDSFPTRNGRLQLQQTKAVSENLEAKSEEAFETKEEDSSVAEQFSPDVAETTSRKRSWFSRSQSFADDLSVWLEDRTAALDGEENLAATAADSLLRLNLQNVSLEKLYAIFVDLLAHLDTQDRAELVGRVFGPLLKKKTNHCGDFSSEFYRDFCAKVLLHNADEILHKTIFKDVNFDTYKLLFDHPSFPKVPHTSPKRQSTTYKDHACLQREHERRQLIAKVLPKGKTSTTRFHSRCLLKNVPIRRT